MTRFGPVLVLTAALSLGACVTSGSQFSGANGYQLGPAQAAMPSARMDSRALVVGPVGAVPSLQGRSLMVTNENGVTSASRSAWAQTLPEQVQARLTEFFSRTGGYPSVTAGTSAAPGQMMVNATLQRFEEVRHARQSPAIVVAMDFQIYDPANDIVLLTAAYSETLPVVGSGADATIATMTTAMNRIFARLEQELAARRR